MQLKQQITPCLWFDEQTEEAADFYVDIFPDSRITRVIRYAEAGFEVRGKAPVAVLTVAFELNGQPFTALNGEPAFSFSEAVSLRVMCAS